MKFYQPLNIDSTKIAVTSTATSLFDLMNTAGSTSEHRAGYPQEANTLILSVEDGSIRVSLDGTSPTADEGLLLTTGTYTISCDLDLIELIRVGGTNVNCSVAIGESINGADMTASPVSSGGGGGGDATLAEQEAQTALLGTIDADTGNIATNTSNTATKLDTLNAVVANSAVYKYYSDSSFVTGDSPVTIDLATALGGNPRTINVYNDGLGDLELEFSTDGSTYGDNILIKGSTNGAGGVGELRSYVGMNFSHMRVVWVADTAYRLEVFK